MPDRFLDVKSVSFVSVHFWGPVLLTHIFDLAGLVFLLQHPDLSSTMIDAFRGTDDVNECIPLRYASVLISKGFFCRLLDVGINLEMHLRVVSDLSYTLVSPFLFIFPV